MSQAICQREQVLNTTLAAEDNLMRSGVPALMRPFLLTFYPFVISCILFPQISIWLGALSIPALAFASTLRCGVCQANYYYKDIGFSREGLNVDYSFKPHSKCRKCGSKYPAI